MSAYLTYKLWKALILLGLAFVGGLIYGWINWKTPEQGQPDTPPNPADREQP